MTESVAADALYYWKKEFDESLDFDNQNLISDSIAEFGSNGPDSSQLPCKKLTADECKNVTDRCAKPMFKTGCEFNTYNMKNLIKDLEEQITKENVSNFVIPKDFQKMPIRAIFYDLINSSWISKDKTGRIRFEDDDSAYTVSELTEWVILQYQTRQISYYDVLAVSIYIFKQTGYTGAYFSAESVKFLALLKMGLWFKLCIILGQNTTYNIDHPILVFINKYKIDLDDARTAKWVKLAKFEISKVINSKVPSSFLRYVNLVRETGNINKTLHNLQKTMVDYSDNANNIPMMYYNPMDLSLDVFNKRIQNNASNTPSDDVSILFTVFRTYRQTLPVSFNNVPDINAKKENRSNINVVVNILPIINDIISGVNKKQRLSLIRKALINNICIVCLKLSVASLKIRYTGDIPSKIKQTGITGVDSLFIDYLHFYSMIVEFATEKRHEPLPANFITEFYDRRDDIIYETKQKPDAWINQMIAISQYITNKNAPGPSYHKWALIGSIPPGSYDWIEENMFNWLEINGNQDRSTSSRKRSRTNDTTPAVLNTEVFDKTRAELVKELDNVPFGNKRKKMMEFNRILQEVAAQVGLSVYQPIRFTSYEEIQEQNAHSSYESQHKKILLKTNKTMTRKTRKNNGVAKFKTKKNTKKINNAIIDAKKQLKAVKNNIENLKKTMNFDYSQIESLRNELRKNIANFKETALILRKPQISALFDNAILSDSSNKTITRREENLLSRIEKEIQEGNIFINEAEQEIESDSDSDK
jgi:hypothetical protein